MLCTVTASSGARALTGPKRDCRRCGRPGALVRKEFRRSSERVRKKFDQPMPATFEINPSFCFTLMGTFVIYLWTRPARSAWLAVFILAVALRLACVRLMGGLGTYYGVWWISWGAFLGIASLMVLAAQAF